MHNPAKAAIKKEFNLAKRAAARAGTIKKLEALTSKRVAGPARIIRKPAIMEAKTQLMRPTFFEEIPKTG